MASMHPQWTRWAGALVIAIAQAQFAAAAPATPPNAPDTAQLLVRLQRLERDMRDLEAATFRKPSGDKGALPAPPAPDPDVAAPAPEPPPVMPDLNPLLRRIDELEDGLGRMTGQMELLGHKVDQLTEKTERLQKQLDLQASAQAKAEVSAPANPPPPDPNQLASVTPESPSPELALGTPPSILGTIPADTPLPKPEADPKRQFDAAMSLLSRARYDEASDAFRAFADAHPDEDRAPDALYWTGDIAYSTKKDYPAAARDFAELLKKYPKAQRAPDGMLKLGLALFEMGQAKEACAAVSALPVKYPAATPAIVARAKSVRDEKKCR